jgi:hypothetical protein
MPFAPRDPENLDPMGPQNHPLPTSPSAIESDDDLIAALRRIERKADIMRIDARAQSNMSAASDAEEIRLLAGIALRRVGSYA